MNAKRIDPMQSCSTPFKQTTEYIAGEYSMETQETLWWLARPGTNPEGPFDRSAILGRLATGATGWLICRIGSAEWKSPHSDPDLASLLAPPPPSAQQISPDGALPPASANPYKGLIIFLHISQLAGYIVPGLGFILPLVLWLTNRDKPDVDRHGKEVVNFMIIIVASLFLSGLLCLILIGFLLLPVVLIFQLVCVIVAVVKAGNDEFFRYPMLVRFIS
jgi:hypothetical protein